MTVDLYYYINVHSVLCTWVRNVLIKDDVAGHSHGIHSHIVRTAVAGGTFTCTVQRKNLFSNCANQFCTCRLLLTIMKTPLLSLLQYETFTRVLLQMFTPTLLPYLIWFHLIPASPPEVYRQPPGSPHWTCRALQTAWEDETRYNTSWVGCPVVLPVPKVECDVWHLVSWALSAEQHCFSHCVQINDGQLLHGGD